MRIQHLGRVAQTGSKFAPRVRRASVAFVLLLVPDALAAQSVWTRSAPVYALAGAGDILAAATGGGVLLWDLSSGRLRHATTAAGLPTQIALAAAIFPDSDALCVATTNGMARGWFDGAWEARAARTDEKGLGLSACLTLPAGRAYAGGIGGRLLVWHGVQLDSLVIPTRTGRVHTLALFTAWIDAGAKERAHDVGKTGEPLFPLGLAAGMDNDGVWLLRAVGPSARWLRFVQEDGLPSRRVRHILVDSRGRLWVATDRGVGWIGADLGVRTFPTDSLLTRSAHALLEIDGSLYVGLDDGLARIDLDVPEAGAVRVPGIAGLVVTLARTLDDLWWSDGIRIHSLGGRELVTPAALADNFCMAVLARADTLPPAVWVGHPFGTASEFDGTRWTRAGAAQGLPADDITSFARDRDSLFVGTASSGLWVGIAPARGHRIDHASVQKATAGQPHFAPVAGAPTHVSTQAFARGAHWVGGGAGLVARRGATWEALPLWPGATEVVDVLAAADTLWVSAATGGLAYHDGVSWIRVPTSVDLVGRWFGRMSRSAGRFAVATDRGVALWNGRAFERAAGSPDAFVLDVAWWGESLAVGTHRGLWVLHPDGAWSVHGVLDGLPGAQVRGLDVDDDGALWVATTRGVGRYRTLRGSIVPTTMERRASRARIAAPVPPSTAPRDWAVYDVRGRLVCRLGPLSVPKLDWDGLDASGQRAPSGVYFLRAFGARDRWTARQIVLH